MKRVMVAIICFMAIIVIGLVVVLFLGLTNKVSWFDQGSFFWQKKLLLANRQVVSASDLTGISTAYSSEKITLLAGNDGEIVLEEYMNSWEENMLANVTTSAGVLNISNGERPFGFWLKWRCEIKLYVPRNCIQDVALQLSSGSLTIDDSISFHALTVRSNSGSIHLGDVSSKTSIAVHADSGRIRIGKLSAQDTITLTNSSGSIETGNLQGKDIAVNGNSGSIRIAFAAADTVKIDSNSGSIKIDEIHGAFDIANSSGSIHLYDGIGHGTVANNSGSIAVHLRELTGDLALYNLSGSNRLELRTGTSFDFEADSVSGSTKTPENIDFAYKSRNHVYGTIGNNGLYIVTMSNISGSNHLIFRS